MVAIVIVYVQTPLLYVNDITGKVPLIKPGVKLNALYVDAFNLQYATPNILGGSFAAPIPAANVKERVVPVEVHDPTLAGTFVVTVPVIGLLLFILVTAVKVEAAENFRLNLYDKFQLRPTGPVKPVYPV